MKHSLLTGDRPSGPLHLGHYVGSLKARLAFQESYDAYLIVADLQALTDHFDQPDKVRDAVYEVTRDYLAVGIDPKKTKIFIQSQIPELSELAFYYMNLVTVARLERNPTVKAEIQQKGMSERVPVGFFCYPISQAADITAFGGDSRKILVPVGEDQLPMIELCNEIVRRFNATYKVECLSEAEAFLGPVHRLMGLDGKHKASKSLNNAIFLGDSPECIREKVFSMFTDPNHIRASDPGAIKGNVVFEYLDAFHPCKEEVDALKAHYQKGGLGDVALKTELNQVLQALLAPIRERRQALTHHEVENALQEGTVLARQKAQKTLALVRQAMGLIYSPLQAL
jgi:tryptophanyl-tRNA synthetase